MKDLTTFINKSINEAFRINKNTKLRTVYKYTPEKMSQLQNAIISEIKLQGKDADLNCIDTSKITTMFMLFARHMLGYRVGNIDISKWDVSNVKDMYSMFKDQENFNCDLSKWDVSNVKDMDYMFSGCTALKDAGNIPEWFKGKSWK